MSDAPRVRFAPSPTGYLHVGGARTALFNWLFARHEGGAFVLRIEDTDKNRSKSELTDTIIDGLEWLGLDWDEGPHHQADFVQQHRANAQQLLDAGHAYRCFCTPEELEERRSQATAAGGGYMYDRRCRALTEDEVEGRINSGQASSVRFRVPPGETIWDDLVHGRTRFVNDDIEDFVILRSDSTPTYHLAVVSDDIEMGITHVIRGADHTSNTPKQILLYSALGTQAPAFGHVPLIMGPDGKRLSKRHGAMAVGEYRSDGYLPHAMVNFLALLGWSPGGDLELMDVPELVERFSLKGINKKSAIFDHQKLDWLNGQYLTRASAKQISDWVAPFVRELDIVDASLLEEREDWWMDVLELVKVRARTLHDVAWQAAPFFAGEVDVEPEAAAKHWTDPEGVGARLARLRERLTGADPWAEDALEQQLRGLAAELDIGAGQLIHPLRVALTGRAVSPGIFEVMCLMGRELVLSRIDEAIGALAEMTRSANGDREGEHSHEEKTS